MVAKLDGTNGLLQSYDYQVPTTGFSYTFAAGIQTLIMNPAGTLATGTITMPASPSDGMTITISSSQTITALTLQGNTGQSISNTITSLPANTTAQYLYRLSNTTWYPSDTVPVAATSTYVGQRGQAFTGNNTFTIPTGVTAVKVTVVGGGGNGGNYAANGCSFLSGGGGGGGGTAISYLTGLTPGNTLSVTVGGAGGTSSVASGTQTISTISATGGSNGTNATAVSVGIGGSGGLGSGGTINIGGGGGGGGSLIVTYTPTGGVGGSSTMGGGGAASANAGRVYGGGGSGGSSGNGAAGAAGIVVFEW